MDQLVDEEVAVGNLAHEPLDFVITGSYGDIIGGIIQIGKISIKSV